ncbi:MAG: SRPBCC family protein [Actinomycetota bacterium]
MARGRGNGRANALGRQIVVRTEERSEASPEAVYALLSDPRSHLTWAGERQSKKTRLLSVDAPEGPVGVGSEFTTTGADPLGSFADRSVVTEAAPGRTLEFVTEARLHTKKGRDVDWTNVHRYELHPDGSGTKIVNEVTIARISELPGMLAVFKIPLLSGLAVKASAGVARRGVKNLARMAEEGASRPA